MPYLIPMQQPMYGVPRQPMRPPGFQVPAPFAAPPTMQPRPAFQPPMQPPAAYQMPTAPPRPVAMPQPFQPPAARPMQPPQQAPAPNAPRVPQAPQAAGYTEQELQQAIGRLGPDSGVTVKQLLHYLKAPGEKVNIVQAIARAVTDNAWADELQKAKIKTGDAFTDQLLWKQHWDFVQGRTSQDPLLTKNPKAMEEIAKRVSDVIREYHSSGV